MRPAGTDPAESEQVREQELLQFLLYLGSALTAAGEAVNQIQDHLVDVSAAYGAPHARVAVLPTYLEIALGPGLAATLEPTRQLRGALRLDQTAAVYEVLREAKHGDMPLAEGSRRILEIVEMRPRFGRLLTIFGHAVLTVGICLVIQPTW